MDLSRYLDLFVSESRDHLGAAAGLASRIDAGTGEGSQLRDLFRHLHSLKGMAASMGFGVMQDLAHAAEALLDAARDGRVPLDGVKASLILDATGCLERIVEKAERGESPDDPDAAGIATRLREAALPELDSVPAPARDPAPAEIAAAGGATAWRVALIVGRDRPFPAVRAAIVLGRLGALGRVVWSEPPMALLRTGRFDGRLAVRFESDLDAQILAASLARMEDVESFSLQPAPPLETVAARRSPASWVRVRAEILDALLEDAQELLRVQRDAGRGARAESLALRLHRGLAEVRLIPFDQAAQRLVRGARELARALGKEVDFVVEGREVRVDRALIDHVVDPLLHLVRNALDHGLEAADGRKSAGKPARGTVRLAVERQGAWIVLTVEDDGRGLDPAALRRHAVDKGFLAPAEAAHLDDGEALMLATLPGFSTAVRPTEVSGRGVGLDVVRAAVEELGGRMSLAGRPGRGARVTLTLPASLSIAQVLLVRHAGLLYGVPAGALAGARAYDARNDLPSTRLDEILGEPVPGPSGPFAARLEVSVAARRGLVLVDEVVGRAELVVRPLAPALSRAGLFTGASTLEDGSIVLVLAPAALLA